LLQLSNRCADIALSTMAAAVTDSGKVSQILAIALARMLKRHGVTSGVDISRQVVTAFSEPTRWTDILLRSSDRRFAVASPPHPPKGR
jgi:hypothetical protein